MQKKGKKNLQKTRRTRAKAAKSNAPVKKVRAKKSAAAETDKASQRFVEDLLTREEAAELTEEGKLPLDATHVITKKNPDGTVEVKRVRYKVF